MKLRHQPVYQHIQIGHPSDYIFDEEEWSINFFVGNGAKHIFFR
jgi:hypothetical protein